LIGQRYVDQSSEWRNFLNAVGGIDGSGVGAAADHSLAHAGNIAATTTIPYPASAGSAQSVEANDNDTHGGAAGPSRDGAMPKMRGAVSDKPLADAFHSIDDMAARLGLAAAVRDRAKEVFRKLEYAKVLPRGGKCRNRHALYAACLHVACRAVGTPRTFKELASVTGDSATAGIKDIGRLVKSIKIHLGEEDCGQPAGEITIGAVVQAGDYLRRFGSLVGIGDQEMNAALEAVRRLEKNLDVRRNPDSIAAAVIYMAVQRAGAGKSVREVSTATGVGQVTIREVCYKDLGPHAELLFG
jgi:transcription initiation factor TFIIB